MILEVGSDRLARSTWTGSSLNVKARIRLTSFDSVSGEGFMDFVDKSALANI